MIGVSAFGSIGITNDNGGLIHANVNSQTLTINPASGNTFVNNGSVLASDGGTIQMTSSFGAGAFTNNGTFEVQENSFFDLGGVTLTNMTGGSTTLNGGRWVVDAGGGSALMSLPGFGINAIGVDTTVRLKGNGALLQSGSQDIANSLQMNDGHLVLLSHDMFAGNFTTNNGRISIDGAASLDTGNNLLTNNGTLEGHGQVIANGIVHGGTISPGFSAGSFEIISDVDFLLSSLTLIEIGGILPNEFDHLDITGTVDLDGKLEVQLIDGYVPAAVGDEWLVLTATDMESGLAESFSEFISPQIGGADVFSYEVRTLSGGGYGVYLISTNAIPEPGVAGLFGGLACMTFIRRRRRSRGG